MEVSGEEYFHLSAEVDINPVPHMCPVCDKSEFSEGGSYDICELCGWEDDPGQEKYPELNSGANKKSLISAREFWTNTGKKIP